VTVVMPFFAATPFWMLFLSEFLVCRDSLDHNKGDIEGGGMTKREG
jgi:hypothetical protein